MEALEQQSAGVLAGKSKLRYPLRSASKSTSREDKEKPQVSIPSSAPRRAPSTLSKSVSVLQLSGDDKSARPPRRRLSVPPKSVAATALKPPATAGNITPISETRVKRSATKNDTPLSNASMASTRKKFNAIALASYWLSQIKISESVAKHSISLAFFKLALEAGMLRNELKSYVGRHDLSEFGEAVKELFVSYNISDHQEQTQVSETCSHVLPEDTTRSSDDEVHSSLSVTGTRKLRPRSLNADAAQVSIVTESTNKETSQRKNTTTIRTRGSSLNKNTENSRTVSDTGGRRVQKKPQKGSKEETTKITIKKQEKKSAAEEGDGTNSPTAAAITP
ncbi:MICROTUBULE-ASSOCIATED FUTSCH-LIKE PROTEIN [Salix viminalis]|uniref:MICROTUBULE-ASSOCIATED FUTSCH-LIKE PROTEIN n=1 Tax=Salix viminalis TaxID=40686 RepID=A0A9Q0NVQ8_SALVM|nr:MICROTUBULE-ASSOCIATED FUTSCH-LIKE PROTEIN [Salix viminalis]